MISSALIRGHPATNSSSLASATGPAGPPPLRRILFLAPQPFFQERGTPIATRAVLEVLSARGYQIDLLTYPEGEDIDIPGCSVHRIRRVPGVRAIRPGFSAGKLACDAAMLLRSAELLRKTRYDLIHAVEEAAMMAAAIQPVFKVPYVYDMDSSLAQQMVESYPAIRALRRPLELCERFAVRRSIGVLAVCRSLEELAVASAPGKLIARVEDVSMVGGAAGGDERLRETIGADGPIVLYVGNLEPYQGIDLLLEGFARALPTAPKAQLVIIGGQEQHIREYRSRAGELGIGSRVHLLGPRPLDQLGWYLPQATVLVSPRTQGTNTPMKIYSYLDAGRPTVATRLPTHTQVLDDQIAMLVEPKPEAFGQDLARLLGNDCLQARLAAAARERVRQEFTPAAFARKINHFYDAVEQRLAPSAVRNESLSQGQSFGTIRTPSSTRVRFPRTRVGRR